MAPRVCRLATLSSLALACTAWCGTTWVPGTGDWSDAAHWKGAPPDVYQEAIVGGESHVRISNGDFAAASLAVGNAPGDHSTVELDGGTLLLRQDSLRIGEYTGSEGRFVLAGGELHCAMDVFVGAVTATSNRMTHADLEIRGGTFVGLSLTVGEGLGSQSRVQIDGSHAKAIRLLEHLTLAAKRDPSGRPARTALSFVLDEGGVTPITITSRWTGLRINHDAESRCDLEISLRARPPAGNITLVSSRVATEGTFSDRPEGSAVTAESNGTTYRWTLTYRGGAGGHDMVLLGQDATKTATEAPVAMPDPLWRNRPVYALAIPAGDPAFPGAEGYGAFTPGGRDGREIAVDTLNDSGPGSLRAALEASGPRRIAFRVAGTILLRRPIVVTEPFVTCDGSDAAAPGITLRRHGLEIRSHDVVLRHLRIRIGDDDVRTDARNVRYSAGDGEYALQFIEGSRNCIADHLSLSWSTNKILSTTKMSDLITIQWCILSESLNLEGHGYAAITGGNRVTWHHNLFAHNFSRNVRFQGAVDADFRNNVVYDWGEKSAYGEFDRLNYVGNYLKPGPSTTQHPRLFHDGTESVLPGSLYLAGNVLEGDARATTDNWKATRFYYDRTELAAPTPFPAPAVTTDSAETAFARVLERAGATQPKRDPIDTRVVREVKEGTGRLVTSVPEAGGWPAN